ncbi:unnamed protein product [Closterium sp. Naga37s-1]|nr:unnamed protein product [Closterium sp. Naga37s-1]
MIRPSLSSSSVIGIPGGSGGASPAGPGNPNTFCPSPRWVGKRSPVAFQRDPWGQQGGSQQEGRQQGGRENARRHSVSEIDGSVFEELALAAQQLQQLRDP